MMFNNIVLYIKNNTELLSMSITHISIITLIIVLASIFKRYNLLSFVSGIKLRFATIIYTLCLFLFILLNVLDTLQPLSFVLYFLLLVPYVMVSKCNKQTKVYLMLTYNICYCVSTHVNPFLGIQANEPWVYVVVVFCVCVLLLWFSWRKVVLVVVFLSVLNFFVLSVACLVSALDLNVMPLYMKLCFMLLSLSLYVIFFVLYYTVTHICCRSAFELFCARLNRVSRLRFILVSVALVLLSLCLRNMYIYNIFVYHALDYLKIVVLLAGTKNPHHEWLCGPGMKHLFGSHCRKMSVLIYKQQHQDELRKLYAEIVALEDQVKQTKVESKWEELGKTVRRHRANHYGCLVTKDDGRKALAFVTHSKFVNDNEPTLSIDKSGKERSRVTSVGLLVDGEYEQEVLPNISKMRETRTDDLNTILNDSPKEYRKIETDVQISNENVDSFLEEIKTKDIPTFKQTLKGIKQQLNDKHNEVD